MSIQTDYLAISWSTSRGRDTYGYNVCRLDVRSTDQRFRCMGGGYDMIGTVVGEWLEATYQDRLVQLAATDPTRVTLRDKQGITAPDHGHRRLYGFTFNVQTGKVSLDGACGIESMLSIAEAIGISLSRTYSRKGTTTGFIVTDHGSAEALTLARK